MKYLFAIIAMSLPATLLANEGRLGTLPPGRYLCELPGDATGTASVPVPDLWFDVINASSYSTGAERGTYLLTGNTVVFTRGPWRGARLERVSDRSLRRTDLSGDMARLRCVRSGRGAAD